jgi:hypothetical protein
MLLCLTAPELPPVDRDDAGEPEVTNSFEHPEQVAPRFSTGGRQGSRVGEFFPRYSLTVLQWEYK